MSKTRRPPKGTRTWMAWMRAEEILADGEWHRTSAVEDAMCAAGDVGRKTAQNLLTEAVGWGVVERRGLKHGVGSVMMDDRKVRLVPVTRRVTVSTNAHPRPLDSEPRSGPRRRRISTPIPPDDHVMNEPVNPPGKLLSEEDLAAIRRREAEVRRRRRRGLE
jgi:hypothetical protein